MQRIASLGWIAAMCIATGAMTLCTWAQGPRPQDAVQIAHRNATEKELESIAIIERKVMVPMHDGKRDWTALLAAATLDSAG